ncbi:unnamed protein product [Urochloa humidicola]
MGKVEWDAVVQAECDELYCIDVADRIRINQQLIAEQLEATNKVLTQLSLSQRSVHMVAHVGSEQLLSKTSVGTQHAAQEKPKMSMSSVSFEGAAIQTFDEMPYEDVVWDDEPVHNIDSQDSLLQQLAQGVADSMHHKDIIWNEEDKSEVEKTMFPAPTDVVWDEEIPSDMDAHTSWLHQLVQGRELVCDELLPSRETHADLFPIENGVALHVETPANINSHILQQLAWREDFEELGMAERGKMLDAKACKIVMGNEEMTSGLNADEDLLQQFAGGMESINNEKATLMNEVPDKKHQKDTIWDEELPGNLNAHDGLLQHLALGSDYLIQEQSKLNTVQLDPNLRCGLFQQLASGDEFLDDKMKDHIIGLDVSGALLQVYYQSTKEASVACKLPNKMQSWRDCFCLWIKETQHVLQEEHAGSEQQLKQQRLTRRQWDPGIQWIRSEYKCYSVSYS